MTRDRRGTRLHLGADQSRNTIAIVSDGSRVLGLGNIGPKAWLPVMEGKALLFKVLGGVDALPLCVRPRNDEELMRTGAVLLAALMNALELVGKPLDDVRIAMIGVGAANVAGYRLLTSSGVNPVPEIWPDEVRAAGARIAATGRSDLPNQVKNSLAFPGIFRGVLDVRARRITDGLAIAAARELAAAKRWRPRMRA